MMTMTMGEGEEDGEGCTRVMLKYKRKWEMGWLVSLAIVGIRYTVFVNVVYGYQSVSR